MPASSMILLTVEVLGVCLILAASVSTGWAAPVRVTHGLHNDRLAKHTVIVPADVPHRHPAYSAVQGLLSRGILISKRGSSFGGEKPVTRYEMAMALYRMVQYLEPRTGGAGASGSREPSAKRGRAGQRPSGKTTSSDPAAWLIAHDYLTADCPLAWKPSSASVSPGLFSDSLAYVTDRILLHRGTAPKGGNG